MILYVSVRNVQLISHDFFSFHYWQQYITDRIRFISKTKIKSETILGDGGVVSQQHWKDKFSQHDTTDHLTLHFDKTPTEKFSKPQGYDLKVKYR